MARNQQIDQVHEIMSFWNEDAEFLKNRLEVFFRGLLSVKAHMITKRCLRCDES